MTSLVKHLGNTQIEQVCFSISEFVRLYHQVRRICNKNLPLCLRLNRVWFEIVYIVVFFLEYLNITQHSKIDFIHEYFYHQHKRDDKNPANIILSRTKNNKQTKIQEWDLPYHLEFFVANGIVILFLNDILAKFGLLWGFIWYLANIIYLQYIVSPEWRTISWINPQQTRFRESWKLSKHTLYMTHPVYFIK